MKTAPFRYQVESNKHLKKLHDRIEELEVQREQSAKGAMRVSRALRVAQVQHRLDLECADKLAQVCVEFCDVGFLPAEILERVVEYQTQRRKGRHELALVYGTPLNLDEDNSDRGHQ